MEMVMASNSVNVNQASADNRDNTDNSGAVYHYHRKTKHTFLNYAKGPETLDWDEQPNPFRQFDGSDKVQMPIEQDLLDLKYTDYFTPRAIQPKAINLNNVSTFLRLSLGLTAWKQYGPDKWSLRANPSSGNLHPTETYLLLGDDGATLQQGLYHYDVENHQLERRAQYDDCIDRDGFYIGFSSVLWREAWKYGERSFRYSQLDIGHTIAAVSSAAAAMGWQIAYLPGASSASLTDFLGLDRNEYHGVESEVAECLLYVAPSIDIDKQNPYQGNLPFASDWFGQSTRLGPRSLYKWPLVDDIAQATLNYATGGQEPVVASEVKPHAKINKIIDSVDPEISFREVVLHRRSAQAYLKESVSKAQFCSVIELLASGYQSMLFTDPLPMHMLIMIHRVDDIEPGIYLFPSSVERIDYLQTECNKWTNWQQTLSIGGRPLLQLKVANVQKAEATLCCQQAIAADCAFTIGFLAEFDKIISSKGVHAYRTLHWQAGMLGQLAYQHATANQLSATGIGCFFDDPWHEFMGIENSSLQLLYQFAIGHPNVDQRITSLSGYYHLRDFR